MTIADVVGRPATSRAPTGSRRWLKAHGITFAGKPLGWPPKRTPAEQKAINAQRRADARARIPIEGKYGQGKGAYGLDTIAARRPDTSEDWIRAIFLVMNLLKLARLLFWLRFWGAYRCLQRRLIGQLTMTASPWRLVYSRERRNAVVAIKDCQCAVVFE